MGGHVKCQIQVVPDGDLPPNVARVIVEHEAGSVLLITESAAAKSLLCSWQQWTEEARVRPAFTSLVNVGLRAV